jgi:hypothetical protein
VNVKIADLLVPTERAQIHWLVVHEIGDLPAVVVLWRPEPDAPYDCDGWQSIRALWHDGSREYSDGACWSAWGKRGRDCEYFGRCTPEHILAGIIECCHHPDPEVWRPFYWEAIRQFARIEGCAWARRMYEQKANRLITRDDLAPYAVLPDGRRVLLPMGPFNRRTAA